jgi:hypothetical protein
MFPGGTPNFPSLPSQPSVPVPSQPQTPALSADAQSALNLASSVLQGQSNLVGTVRPGSGGTVISDAVDSNSADDTNAASVRYQSAVSALQQNQPVAQAALAQLSPDQQSQYAALSAGLSGDPVSQLAAQSLLISGGLTSKDGNDQTLLGTLSGVASGSVPLADGVDRTTFAQQLTKECATPGAINQQQTDDCVPTQASILLDRLDPAEYARVATEAASPSGTVTWADGSQSTRPATLPQGTGQSLPQQMLSATAMEAAGGSDLGASPQGVATMMSKMFNANYQVAQVDTSSDAAYRQSQSNMMQTLTNALSSGAPVSASIELTDPQGQVSGEHEVLVNGITSDGQVEYTNPWGNEEVQPLAEFQSRLLSLSYLQQPPPTVSASQLMMQQGQYLSV